MSPTTRTGTEAALRQAMGNLPTGLTVVTTSTDGVPHGTTLSAVMSLSMDPPLVLLSLARTSSLLARLRRGGRFGVNVLAADQDQIALRFSQRLHDRFADLPWTDEDGAPRLTGAHAWVLGEVSSTMPAGDHVLVVGDVLDAEAAGGRPLTYWQRGFGTHQQF
jgi:flavin reductase (DIM6/NTAB) family NADH-FMN oxidoreductase RutF